MRLDYSHLNSEHINEKVCLDWNVPSVFSPSVAPWSLRDSLPCQDKVSAACLFTGTMPLQAGKEGTLNHPGHDRRTPHTRLPMGAQCQLPALGVSTGNTRYRTGWALDCPQGPACPHRIYYVYSKVSIQHYTQTHINNLRLLWTISRI